MTTQEIKEKCEEINALKELIEKTENDTDAYDEMLDDCYPIKIGNIDFCASRVLKELDEIAYDCGFNDYIDETLSELNENLDELENELKELENDNSNDNNDAPYGVE